MTTIALPRPGASRGPRPERRPSEATAWGNAIRTRSLRSLRAFAPHIDRIHGVEQRLERLIPSELDTFRRQLSQRLSRGGLTDILCEQAFALVGLTADRALGKRPNDEQVHAGWLMHKGMLAQVATGEGKALAVLMPACTAGLAGVPVHMISVNDYLVRRDCALLEPAYAALGLSAGCVVEGDDDEARGAAYGANVTYVSHTQVALDYLCDRQHLRAAPGSLSERIAPLLNPRGAGHAPLLRGLCYAIVDEADSVLIDDVRTPYVLFEQRAAHGARHYALALDIARRLQPYVDFLADPKERTTRLTATGADAVHAHIARLDGIWSNPKFARELVQRALKALHLFRRDEDYLVHDDRVVPTDQSASRITAEHGLQQMIETLEGCSTTERRRPLAQITHQQFFQRYLKLAGIDARDTPRISSE